MVAQKIVRGDMLHGDRFSTIWCYAETRCCKLTRVTPPLGEKRRFLFTSPGDVHSTKVGDK